MPKVDKYIVNTGNSPDTIRRNMKIYDANLDPNKKMIDGLIETGEIDNHPRFRRYEKKDHAFESHQETKDLKKCIKYQSDDFGRFTVDTADEARELLEMLSKVPGCRPFLDPISPSLDEPKKGRPAKSTKASV